MNIARWWTAEHDELMKRLIDQWQWHWFLALTETAVSMAPPFQKGVLVAFQEEDRGEVGVWYNKIMKFAITRAENIGLTSKIRAARWKVCPLCNEKFVEDSLPAPLTKRLGMDHLDFCAPCLKKIVYQGTGNKNAPREQIMEYVRDLTQVLEQIPHQGFGEGISDFDGMDSEYRAAVFRVLQRKPSTERVKILFGSWLQLLIEAGVLEEDARRTMRGTQCVAKDGHVCLSLGEKTIDDFLAAHEIAHDREAEYPESSYRTDFVVNGIFIEYFGLQGDSDYDNKTKAKVKICKAHDVELISIYPADLANLSKLEKKLKVLLAENIRGIT
jgi:hypothetical protein